MKGEVAMRIENRWLLGIGVTLLWIASTSSVAMGQAQHVRWDIISVNFVAPFTASPGGIASAKANDGSQITLTGSGTFVAPGGGGGTSGAATGGGTWQTLASDGTTSTGSGTYEVTGLVRWDRAPFEPGGPPPRIDLIGEGTRSTGLAILRIAYSDGEQGILVVSCTGVTADPPNIFEGVTASKGYVDYWNRVAPAGGVDANRTLFHVR